MDNITNKKQYQSKTIWSILFGAAVEIVNVIRPELMGTPVALILTTLATVFGIYGRVSASDSIKQQITKSQTPLYV